MLVESWLSDSWGIDGELSKGRSKILRYWSRISTETWPWMPLVHLIHGSLQLNTSYTTLQLDSDNLEIIRPPHLSTKQHLNRVEDSEVEGKVKIKDGSVENRGPLTALTPNPTPPFFGILMGPLRTDDDLLKNSVMCPFPNGLTSNITFSTQIHGCRKVLWILRRQFPAKFQLEIEHWILLTLAHTES